MAKRKSRSTVRRATSPYYGPRRKTKKRRTSTLNRSTVKPMKSAGALVGAGLVYGPYAMASIKAKSVTPMVAAITSKNVAVAAVKSVAVGYIGGALAGKVIDTVGLKKPVNKVFRTVKGLI